MKEMEIKNIALKGKISRKQRGELTKLLKKMEKDDTMVFDIPEGGNEILLMGELENCIAELIQQFDNVLEVSEEERLDAESSKLKSGAGRSATAVGDSSSELSSTDSTVSIRCEADVLDFMREKSSSFLEEIKKKYEVDITEDDEDDVIQIIVSGKDRKAAEDRLREEIEKHKAMMAEELKSSEPSRPAPRDPIPAKKQKTSPSSSSGVDTPPLHSQSPKPTSSASPSVSTSGLPLKTFCSKESKSCVHIFAYDITKLKVDVIVNAAKWETNAWSWCCMGYTKGSRTKT